VIHSKTLHLVDEKSYPQFLHNMWMTIFRITCKNSDSPLMIYRLKTCSYFFDFAYGVSRNKTAKKW